MTEHEAKKHALWPDFIRWLWPDKGYSPELKIDYEFWKREWSCFLAGAQASSEFRAAVDEGMEK